MKKLIKKIKEQLKKYFTFVLKQKVDELKAKYENDLKYARDVIEGKKKELAALYIEIDGLRKTISTMRDEIASEFKKEKEKADKKLSDAKKEIGILKSIINEKVPK